MKINSSILKILSIMLVIIAVFNAPVFAENDDKSKVPDQVQRAAEDGLNFLKSKFAENPARYGFDNEKDVRDLKLGDGYQLKYVDAEKLKKDKKGSLLGISNQVDVWQFTADLDGNPKSYMLVANIDGKYKAVRFGGDATEYGKAIKTFKNKTNKNPEIVQVGNEYFLVNKENNEEQVLGTGSKNASIMKKASTDFVSSSTLVKELQERQEENEKNKGRGFRN
ncbi:hypothetical protein [Brevibacillus migulae]|uniref:hypothetical protein n=1 Tax=Brevibacillus migulae TaxID=1644114 RepID=UPI00106EF3E7|nr:hypothetical protein [Brevibacillus migulae]